MYTVVSSVGVVDGYHHQNNIMEHKRPKRQWTIYTNPTKQ